MNILTGIGIDKAKEPESEFGIWKIILLTGY
jgi:hypothetical protein